MFVSVALQAVLLSMGAFAAWKLAPQTALLALGCLVFASMLSGVALLINTSSVFGTLHYTPFSVTPCIDYAVYRLSMLPAVLSSPAFLGIGTRTMLRAREKA